MTLLVAQLKPPAADPYYTYYVQLSNGTVLSYNTTTPNDWQLNAELAAKLALPMNYQLYLANLLSIILVCLILFYALKCLGWDLLEDAYICK